MPVNEVSRIRWLCRRGMKELDVLLSRFLEGGYGALDAPGRRAFLRLLECQDPELYALLTGRTRADDEEVDGVVQRIRDDTGS